MGPGTVIGVYLDIERGGGLAGVELVTVYRTPSGRIIVRAGDPVMDVHLSAALVTGTDRNMDLIRQIADALRALRAA